MTKHILGLTVANTMTNETQINGAHSVVRVLARYSCKGALYDAAVHGMVKTAIVLEQ